MSFLIFLKDKKPGPLNNVICIFVRMKSRWRDPRDPRNFNFLGESQENLRVLTNVKYRELLFQSRIIQDSK